MHRELVERMLAAGHERANFAIVAAGANAASPHHEPTATRTIADGDLVLCDFGGTMDGYCSDITRMFHVGEPPAEVRDVYAVLVDAQEAGVRAATVGTPCEDVDAAARRVIADAGFGENFVHRVGHGIGTEAHEDPYMVAGQRRAARAGPRVQRRARHLFPRSVRDAARGHRRRDRRRTAAPQRRAARYRDRCVKLDAATFLLQWATGGLLFGWVTTRRREVSLGYGWLIRIVFGRSGRGRRGRVPHRRPRPGARRRRGRGDRVRGRGAASRSSSRCSAASAGVRGREEVRAARRARVSAMIGRADEDDAERGPGVPARPRSDRARSSARSGCSRPRSSRAVRICSRPARLVVGAVFLGSVSDAMLLGHWYLVQPGLPRGPVKELVAWTARSRGRSRSRCSCGRPAWCRCSTASIADGYHGVLGWIWIGCAVLTIGLVGLTWAALRERYYSAVMAATGLLYLAILTAFGTDLVARAVLRP